jgi:hypothetical protein
VPEIRAVLEEAIAAGGSTLRDYARPDGELGYFAKDWRVYGREGALRMRNTGRADRAGRPLHILLSQMPKTVRAR